MAKKHMHADDHAAVETSGSKKVDKHMHMPMTAAMPLNSISGSWTYRSWINNPEPVDTGDDQQTAQKLLALLFAEAKLDLQETSPGIIGGRLDLGDYGGLTMYGSAGYGNPFSVRFQGVGKDTGTPSEGWTYDYIGWLVPVWPHGVDQRPAIVGSVIRTRDHGSAKAGKVASFIAVKRDV